MKVIKIQNRPILPTLIQKVSAVQTNNHEA